MWFREVVLAARTRASPQRSEKFMTQAVVSPPTMTNVHDYGAFILSKVDEPRRRVFEVSLELRN